MLKSMEWTPAALRNVVGVGTICAVAGLGIWAVIAVIGWSALAQTPNWSTSPTQVQKRVPAQAPQRNPAAAPRVNPAPGAQPSATQAAAPAQRADWNIQCQNAAGGRGFNCQMSRAVVLKENRKLLLRVTVTLPAQTKKPSLLVQTPFGLFLPAGVRLQIDENTPQAMVLQTCNQNGCFASGPLSAQMLAGMKKGKQLKAIFQNLQKKDITVPLPLTGFTKHYAQMESR
ncbi:MAG: invasion associated locus B family protein [Hyphomicrobiaceae bacterium]|nr:invasion associated locus B family protein [Hyphomicrobiaceae bacterium]